MSNFYDKLNVATTKETLEQLQGNYPHDDTQVFYDVSLESIIENFLENGLTHDDILNFEDSLYNEFIDFYYSASNKMYICFYGMR